MSKRGKRGVASFQKNYKEEDYKVEFDRLNRPVGAMSSPFMSWFGLKVRQTFPYHIDTKDVENYRWEELWLDAKVWFFLWFLHILINMKHLFGIMVNLFVL